MQSQTKNVVYRDETKPFPFWHAVIAAGFIASLWFTAPKTRLPAVPTTTEWILYFLPFVMLTTGIFWLILLPWGRLRERVNLLELVRSEDSWIAAVWIVLATVPVFLKWYTWQGWYRAVLFGLVAVLFCYNVWVNRKR